MKATSPVNYACITLFVAISLLLAQVTRIHAESTNITSSADAGLFENNPDNNLGGMGFVTAGSINRISNHRSRALYKFAVAAALPPNATITSASVVFNLAGVHGEGRTFNLHRVLADWVEGSGSGISPGSGLGAPANPGEVTWNSRFHGTATWTSPGGLAGTDFASTASASAVMGSATLEFTSAGMAADLQAWLNSPGTNFGWVIKDSNEIPIAATHLGTSEDSGTAPVLTIHYSVPAPPPPLLTNVTASPGQFIFSFNAEANRTYTVESRTSLSVGSWNTATNFPSQPSPSTITVTNPITGTEGYYRVRTP